MPPRHPKSQSAEAIDEPGVQASSDPSVAMEALTKAIRDMASANTKAIADIIQSQSKSHGSYTGRFSGVEPFYGRPGEDFKAFLERLNVQLLASNIPESQYAYKSQPAASSVEFESACLL